MDQAQRGSPPAGASQGQALTYSSTPLAPNHSPLQKSLKEDWAQIESQQERLVRARMHFEKAVRQEWFLPGGVDADGVDTQRTVRLNIGGERFDIKASLLLKDRFSLLAATTVPPEDAVIKPEADGCFYFDRDWWLFRHVLAYLRDGILPIKQPLLRDLYHEAAFYCLTSLQVCSCSIPTQLQMR